MNDWYSVDFFMPIPYLLVEVKGKYTPEKYEYPIAYLSLDTKKWVSNEHRGSVGITHWRESLEQQIWINR